MMQVARLAPKVLGAEATWLVERFVGSKQGADGGFQDRGGRSDLYYTVFALDALSALQVPLPLDAVRGFVARFGDGLGLDFVHLCCLARIWAHFAERERPAGLLRGVEGWRTPDGGYHQRPGAAQTSAYGAMLAGSAYLDWRRRPPRLWKLAWSLRALRTADGAWANEPGLAEGSTTATAAAVTFYRHARLTPPPELGTWLLAQSHPEGGFKAFPRAPMPDLLSTAVALHALDGIQADFRHLKDQLLDYVDSLWSAEGGFHGHWADDELDLEYTYYGLLALGHLAL
ncbi:MAG: prenyltransferase/squalene oxidase repeat-containing protein [Verrucomicrobiales bacterium]